MTICWDITGVILTKLDGDTRGGAALSVKAVTGKPIKFAGTGEKIGDLEVFHPDRMASRILGMGDVLTLIEDAQQRLDEKAAQKTAQRLMQNKMDLNDLLEQFQQVKKMGPIKGILSKLPGVGNKLDDVDIDDRIMDRSAAIILSMTPYERSHPDCLNASRKKRIAAGCGMKVEDVNRLLNQFRQTQKADEAVWRHGQGEAPAHAQPPPVSFRILPGPAPVTNIARPAGRQAYFLSSHYYLTFWRNESWQLRLD